MNKSGIKRIIVPGLLILAFILFHILPSGMLDEGLIPCPHKALTGIACPLCGMTHSANYLTHFDFISAWESNPVSYLLLLVLLLLSAEQITNIPALKTARKLAVYLFFAGLLILYIVRISEYFSA